MRYWINVEDSDGNVLGGGPLTSVTAWENITRMNASGTFSFTMPIKDPKSELIQDLRIIRAYGMMDSQVVEMGAGIIKNVEVSEQAGTGQIMLRVSGDDLLSELANIRVGELKLYNRRQRHAWKSSWYQPNEADMPQTYDNAIGDTSNAYAITNWADGSDASGNFWYIGFPRHFDTIHIVLGGTVNVVEGTDWHLQYFDPGEFAWIDLNITENTTIGGVNENIWLAQNGLIEFDIPPNWGIEGLYHGPLYEVRLMHTLGTTLDIDLADVAVSYAEPTQDALQIIMNEAPVNWALDDVNGYTQTQAPILVGADVVTNGDFADFTGTADDGATDTFTGWTNVGTDVSNKIEAITTDTGFAVQFTAAVSKTPQLYQEFTVDPATDYRFRFYANSDATSQIIYGFYDANTGRYLARAIYTNITSTAWTAVEERISIPPETVTLRVTFMNTAGVAAVRDVTMAQYISGEVYMELSGESVLEALNRLAEQTGENFIRSYAGRRVLWLGRDKRVADVRALSGGDMIAQESRAELVRITNIVEQQAAYDLATRVYVYGGDVGDSRVTLATTTRQPPSGYVLSKADNYLERSAAVGTLIEKLLEFTDVVPTDSSQSVLGYSSNTIFDRAYEWLVRHSATDATRVTGDMPRAYDLEITKVERPIYPGHAIQVVYYRAVDDVPVISINQYLWILSVIQRVDSNGALTVALEVSTIDEPIKDDSAALVEAIRTLSANNRRNQVPRSESGGQIVVTYPSHTAVTLDANADTVLSISTQALGLDTKAANIVWAGPTTGAAAIPTFRALVSDDIPTLDHGAKLTGLTDDDHTLYLLAAGTRALTGNWDAGDFTITAKKLDIISDAYGTVQQTTYSASYGPAFVSQRANGTEGTPTAVVSNDQLAYWTWNGYQNGGWRSGSYLEIKVGAAPSGNVVPTVMYWYATDSTGVSRVIWQYAADKLTVAAGTGGYSLGFQSDGARTLIVNGNSTVQGSLVGSITGGGTLATGGFTLTVPATGTALLTDGTISLVGNWDAGSFEIRAQTFQSDVVTGTAPLIVASTTKVVNLNADTVDDLGAQTLTATSPIALSGATSVLAAAGITISHAATDGYIHLPTGGSANQILKNSGAAGTGAWSTVTENAGALAAITTATFSTTLIGPAWRPASDSTSALQLQTSSGTAIMTVDSANQRVAIGTTPSAAIRLNVRHTLSDPGATQYGLYVSTIPTFTANNSYQTLGLGGYIQPSVANGFTAAGTQFGFLGGVLVPATHAGAITRAIGLDSYLALTNGAGGTIETLDGVVTEHGLSGASTTTAISTLRFFYAGGLTALTGATVSTAYGLLLGSISGATTNYSIYSSSGRLRWGDFHELIEITAPGAAATNAVRFFARDDGGGVTELCARFATGDILPIARQGITLQTYTPSNVMADRSYDANSTTLDEIADVLGTLIADLQAQKIII